MSEVAAHTIELPARLDVPAAEALLGELLEIRGSDSDLVIAGSAVGLVDTPAIQILMSAARDQAARERAFTLNEPSAAIREAMELMGLENELANWRGCNE